MITQAEPDTPWSPAAFERRFAADPDPWRFETSDYERRRFETTAQALSRARYPRGLELACANGELTRRLAPRCFELVAVDVAPTAVARAIEKCRDLPQCRFVVGDVRADLPAGPFDLIVASEIGYYFSAAELRTLARDLWRRLAPDGELVAVHWLGHSADHRMHGDRVHDLLEASFAQTPDLELRDPGFRLDRWRRRA